MKSLFLIVLLSAFVIPFANCEETGDSLIANESKQEKGNVKNDDVVNGDVLLLSILAGTIQDDLIDTPMKVAFIDS